jgi:hypothetical protein
MHITLFLERTESSCLPINIANPLYIILYESMVGGMSKCFSQPTYPFQNRLFAFNPLRVPSPQHHPDRNIGEEEKKEIADLHKSHAAIIQQIIFVLRYLK